MRPVDPMLARMLLIRGAVIWTLTRLFVLSGFMLAAVFEPAVARPGAPRGTILSLSVVGVVWLLVACAFLAFIDLRRRKEQLILRNLGIGPRQFLTLSMLPALVGELLLLLTRS